MPFRSRSFPLVAAAAAALGVSVILAACLTSTSTSTDTAPAEVIVRVASVITLDPDAPSDADAVAIRGGRVAAVGRFDALAARLRGAETRVEDLRPGVAVPGLVDAHAHLLSQGLLGLDLLGTRSAAEVEARVAAAVAKARPGEWIIGRRWDQNDWPEKAFPGRAVLDRVAPDHPVCLTRIDGHAAWVNSCALARSGIDADTADPPGGRIHRDPGSREPSGILVDNAMLLVKRPKPDRAAKRQAILRAAAECHRLGLTGVHDAWVDAEGLSIYRELYAADLLQLRVYAMIGGSGPLLERYLARGPEVDAFDGRLTVRALKLYADGALGSRGAALLEPYSDAPGERGLLVTPPEQLRAIAFRAADAGLQVCVHAIGDRANRIVLDTFAACRERTGAADARHRVEHAQVLHPDDIPRFAELGVIASMQPTHLTSDMPWALDRLGPERAKGAYAWRRLVAGGARLCAGSDFPIEQVNPLYGLYSAITRRRTEAPGEGVYGVDQCLTPEEALRAFTAGAALAAFQEEDRGTLSPGRRADITVLPFDPLRTDPERLRTARIVATIVGGQVVYRQPRD